MPTVADGDPMWELRRLGLTDAGAARYATLGERQRDSLQAPPPEHGTQLAIETPAGRRSSTGPLAPHGGHPDPTRTPPGPVPRSGRPAVVAESPDVVIGMGLLDTAKRQGFQFRRIAPGPDGPLWGVRETQDWRDTVYLSGFWAPDSCSATRRRKSSLLVPGDLLVTKRISGDALNVLNTVVSYWPP